MSLDAFTAARIRKVVGSFKESHGVDPSEAALRQAGFEPAVIDAAVRSGLLVKHQVTVGKGSVENRYRVAKDWRALNT
jgi:hypothetical protein